MMQGMPGKRPEGRIFTRVLAGLALFFLSRAAPSALLQGNEGGDTGRADYVIEARLESAEDGSKRLTGRLRVSYVNHTQESTSEAWFHLYDNAYASNRSTHLRESWGALDGDEELEDGFGWQRVTAVRAGASDLTGSLRYRAPDDGNPLDRTVVSVDLAAPLGPGETLELEVDWEALLPRLRRRTGYKDDFVFMAHWFPKLGVFEGERGWNCHQFHANTEFYADYGTYDVTLDLPAEYEGKIGASGKMVEASRRIGERVVTRFVAPSPPDQERVDATGKRPLVHGFAWTADPDFVKKEATFHYDAWRSEYADEVELTQRALGPEKDLRLRNVEITLLIQPEHEDQWRAHVDATEAALFFYGLWFGEYPYEHITVVDPAWGADAAGGMEYPTLFTCGTRIGARTGMHQPESVTVHEAGHQFWYGLVGNNEFEAAWLDEGLNSYTDSEVMLRRYGESQGYTWYSGVAWRGVEPAPGPGGTVLASALAARSIPLYGLDFELTPLRPSGFLDAWRDQPELCFVPRPTDPRWNDRVRYLRDPDRDPIDTPGWQYADRESYRTNSYPRTAVALRSLEGLVGRERFLRGMRHFAETWRYRHPYPDDFFAAFAEGAGADLDWYFEALFRGTGTVDWSVDVEQRREPRERGFVQESPDRPFSAVPPPEEPAPEEPTPEEPTPEDPATEDPATEGPATEPLPEDGGGQPAVAEEAGADERPWRAEVLIVRRGELCLPLEYELRFDDGSIERHVWSREDQLAGRWLALDHAGPKKLAAVLLDPDRDWYLDTDMSNNSWFDEVDRLAPVRWSERVFNRYLHLLHWQSGLGG